ncbi:alpha/beta fold hydrolase [Hirschia litorea]|uniref:Alpha/beta fold hydrolase n=1 Tax=Hirschia litorea TaxID=1199156 RepID=A0ABW2IKM3_9PROT
MARTKRMFVDGAFGQIHLRMAVPKIMSKRPLLMMHMSPKSGRLFAGFVEDASTDRIIIAHDYPGFGESDPPPSDPHVTIEDYAQSVWDVVDALDLGKVDLLGYHTGSEVVAEAARQRPESVGGIVMVSAPIFTAEDIAEMKQTYSFTPLDAEGTRFKKMWAAVKAHRGPGMTLEMMAVTFSENLRAGENYDWGHRAAIEYATTYPETVKKLPHRITVLMPDDDLAFYTPRIIPLLQNGEVVDCPNWGHGFLDAHREQAISVIKTALDAS